MCAPLNLSAFAQVFSDVLRCIGVHVYVFPPSKILNRNFYTIVTMGMSGTHMKVPNDIEDKKDYSRAELMCYLPADWKLPSMLTGRTPDEHNPSEEDKRCWPFEMLRSIAGYVIETGAWVADSHGIPRLIHSNDEKQWVAAVNEDGETVPFIKGSKLTHTVLLEPCNEREGFSQLTLKRSGNGQRSEDDSSSSSSPPPVANDKKGSKVNFYLVIPVTTAEAQWKRDVGAARSIFHIVGDRRINANIPIDYVISPHRLCSVVDLNWPEKLSRELAKDLLPAVSSAMTPEDDTDENEEPDEPGSDLEEENHRLMHEEVSTPPPNHGS
uniref:Suppressor of fused-like domain-containing protein n=1 Tax=Lotharella globosa TaxID=91324 RepID=A0A7S3ZBT6_9EUKA